MIEAPVNANLFSIVDTRVWGIVTSNPNISMPKAYVYVNGTVTASWDYNFDINCSYMVRSNNTCNVTIAFVYPWYISDDYITSESGAILGNYSISVDDVPVYHETKTLDEMPSEIKDTFSLYETEFTFEIFNTTLTENVTSVIQIFGEFEYSTSYDIFDFCYFVDSARWWAGNTREIVKIELDVLTIIDSVSFTPDSFLSVTVNDTKHTGMWNFTIDEFPQYESPCLQVLQRFHPQFPSTTTSTSPTTTSSLPTSTTSSSSIVTPSTTAPTYDGTLVMIVGLVGASVIALIVIAVYFLRKR